MSSELPEQDDVGAIAAVSVAVATAVLVLQPTERVDYKPYSTSALSGYAWLQEQLSGNDRKIRDSLGISRHVFHTLVEALRLRGNLDDSKYVAAEEQVVIFLYICRKGASVRDAVDRFQRSNDTITK